MKGICVQSIGGMTVTGENRSTLTKSSPTAILSTINATRTVLGSNTVLINDRLLTDCLRDGTFKSWMSTVIYIVTLLYNRSVKCIWKKILFYLNIFKMRLKTIKKYYFCMLNVINKIW